MRRLPLRADLQKRRRESGTEAVRVSQKSDLLIRMEKRAISSRRKSRLRLRARNLIKLGKSQSLSRLWRGGEGESGGRMDSHYKALSRSGPTYHEKTGGES